ncbi:MAG: nucleotide exchange factor GrpE [Lachnospiraceae bacterium]
MPEEQKTGVNVSETESADVETKEAVETEETVETEQTAEAVEETQTTEAVEEEETGAETAEEKKKGLFKKKKSKQEEKIEELTDQVKRQMAEFDNFRKRTEKEKEQMYEVGAKSIIEKILPVIDNFERGLSAVKEDQKDDPFVDGMDKVYKQMVTALEDMGVKAIDTTDAEFDPNFHNAVMHIEDENFGENMIAEEFQKGYMYRDTVIRHSMVKVAN